MKLQLQSHLARKKLVSAALLILASASLSHGMTCRHVRQQATLQRTKMNLQYLVPRQEQANDWYQPPRSPGSKEEFGS